MKFKVSQALYIIFLIVACIVILATLIRAQTIYFAGPQTMSVRGQEAVIWLNPMKATDPMPSTPEDQARTWVIYRQFARQQGPNVSIVWIRVTDGWTARQDNLANNGGVAVRIFTPFNTPMTEHRIWFTAINTQTSAAQRYYKSFTPS